MTDIQLPNRPHSEATKVEQSRAVAEVAAAVKVAREFPRSVDRARSEMSALCNSLAVANRAFYEVPNRGSGLSVHIARELARIWGNIDYGVRELHRDDANGISEMQAWAWDQETNVRSTRSFIQPHDRMVKGSRKRLTDLGDIYLNNQNTAARAVRECIFTVLPGWLLADAEDALRATLKGGGGQSIEMRRAGAIEKFADIGVTQKQLETRANKPASKWDANDLAGLIRVYMSITQEGMPAQDYFPEKPVEVQP